MLPYQAWRVQRTQQPHLQFRSTTRISNKVVQQQIYTSQRLYTRSPWQASQKSSIFNFYQPSQLSEEANLPTNYDHSQNVTYWSRRPVMVFGRALQIFVYFAGFFTRTRLGMNFGGDDAADLRHMLTLLGPAFVKIGQAVSARPDILPPRYMSELERLQDRLPAFPDDQAYQVFERELGQPFDQLYSNISNGPVAAASLGQVYKAVLRSSGAQVAVKIQRPGVLEQISLDILILRQVFKIFRKVVKANTDLAAAMDEWATNLYREMDYRQEASHAVEFRSLYMRRFPQIFVPQIHQDLTTRKILTMEWVEGERLDGDLKLVEVGVRCSLEQIMGEGFYHADPHPGNLLRTTDGRLAYLDFGMMGRTTHQMRQALIRTPVLMVNQEIELMAHDFVVLGFLPPETNVKQLVPELTALLEKALENGVGNLSFGTLSLDLGRTLYKYKFRLPSYFTLLVRSLTVLEGIALNADPNFKVLSAAYPWLARRVLVDKSPEIQQSLRALLYKNNKFQFQRLANLLEQAVRAPGKSVYNNIQITNNNTNNNNNSRPQLRQNINQQFSFAYQNQIMYQQEGQALLLLLSDEGTFLRDILIEELAKGLDAAWRISFDQTLAQFKTNQNPSNFVRALLAFPALSNQDDVAQVQGLTLLSNQLRIFAAEPASLNGAPSAISSSTRHNMNEGAAILQWLGREIAKLPPASRQRAVQIPITITQKLSSRVAARLLRSFVSGGSRSGKV